MQKRVHVFLLVALLFLGVSIQPGTPVKAQNVSAGNHRELTTFFYKQPNPDSVPTIIRLLSAEAIREPDRQPPLIGLLSSIFRQFPNRVPEWIALADGRTAKGIVAQALWYADRQEEGMKVLREAGYSQKSHEWLSSQPSSPMRFALSNADHLDILWGAFFGSGDVRYLFVIELAVERVSKDRQIQLEDVIFAARHVGRKNARLRRDAEKYKRLGRRVLEDYAMGIAALWAMGSNSTQHDIVRRYIEYRNDKRPDDAVAIALKRLAFSHTHRKPVYTGEFEGIGVLSAISPTMADAEILGDPKHQPTLKNVSNILKRGMQYFSVQVLHIPAGKRVAYELRLRGPDAESRIFRQPLTSLEPESRLVRFINKIDAAQVSKPGVYTLTLTGKTESGRRFEIAKEILVY